MIYTIRIGLALLFAATSSAPSLGTWEFTGKEASGTTWKGTLTIAKLDPNRFSVEKYFAMCTIEAKSVDSENGVDAPCQWDAATKKLSLTTGLRSAPLVYDAVLSADGKSLQGKWTQSEKGAIVKSGTWSAKIR